MCSVEKSFLVDRCLTSMLADLRMRWSLCDAVPMYGRMTLARGLVGEGGRGGLSLILCAGYPLMLVRVDLMCCSSC